MIDLTLFSLYAASHGWDVDRQRAEYINTEHDWVAACRSSNPQTQIQIFVNGIVQFPFHNHITVENLDLLRSGLTLLSEYMHSNDVIDAEFVVIESAA